MSSKVVGLLHPGNMGATLGAAAVKGGARVLWASERRSQASRRRAEAAGLDEVPTLAELVSASEIVLSVCPPHAAPEVCRRVLAQGLRGVYVDANAVSPETAARMAKDVMRSGARFVDGGIIGPPVARAGSTRLYLSGAEAGEVARLFRGSKLDARVIGGEPGAASALKMAYAAWTKCSDALLLAIRTLASRYGVAASLLDEWELSQPGLSDRSVRAAEATAPKAWRYAGEMREIAATFEAAGLPRGFHAAACALFERLEVFKDRRNPPPTLAEVVEVLSACGATKTNGK
ncbi:MAG TPA: DUF1932 domain-containing protein [Candidatus Binatia bacterium]